MRISVDEFPERLIFITMGKKREKKGPKLFCPVCLYDSLDTISPRMKKCTSCGFIWNHEVSDRDNLLLIVEHKTRLETTGRPALREQGKKTAAT